MSEANRPRAAEVGLKDRNLEGWFNGKTGELAAKWDVVLGMTPEDPKVTERGRGFGPPRDRS